jgi:hypothetical protein
MKAIRFLADFYAVGGSGDSHVKYAKGQTYPADEETQRQVAAGIAEEVDVADAAQVAPAADHPIDLGPSA